MVDSLIVYAGRGSSHSWTWLADLLESNGIFDVRFLDTDSFIESLGATPSTVIVSGGDGFAIASSFSGKGFELLRSHIAAGGLYVGICAGAYLPLRSSVEPFSEFNLSSTKIQNIDCSLSPPDKVPPRIAVRYGSCAIIHPVRGEIELSREGTCLLSCIYGGPVFREPDEDEVLIRFSSFTDNTEFQMSRRIADDMVLGRVAAISSRHGKGRLLLLGPHLEHPNYPNANSVFLHLLGLSKGTPKSAFEPPESESLGRALADLKVAIVGLESRSFMVGRKLWDGSRYLELVRAIEKRAGSLDAVTSERLERALRKVREDILTMTTGSETDADDTTALLVEAARECVDSHFHLLAGRR